jgi:hypothetical protein
MNLSILSLNPNPNGIEILKRCPMHINWNYLSKNPNAIEILKVNQKKINWRNFSENPSIFIKPNDKTLYSYFEKFKFDDFINVFNYLI